MFIMFFNNNLIPGDAARDREADEEGCVAVDHWCAVIYISIFAQLVMREILFKTTSLDNSIPREIFLITK